MCNVITKNWYFQQFQNWLQLIEKFKHVQTLIENENQWIVFGMEEKCGRKTENTSKYNHLVERLVHQWLVHHNLVHQLVLLYNYFISIKWIV